MNVNLPIKGKDVSVQLLVGGGLRSVAHAIGFDEKPVYDETITKPLGRDGSLIDKNFTHWEGSIEFEETRGDLDDIIDEMHFARKNSLPYIINIVRTFSYRNGTSRSYTYPDCELDFEASSRRGESVTKTISWKCGNHRIAV